MQDHAMPTFGNNSNKFETIISQFILERPIMETVEYIRIVIGIALHNFGANTFL
ncbi:MAG: hypothetical protein F6K11_28970 [Leptolyngbya sp. SIO3F4]|nr:hypothetical protein [Leptolyngbya sp. SIO3F4]